MVSLIGAIFTWVFLHGFFFLVSYITNATTFPQPLSESEERKYIILFAQGSDAAKNVLIERNLRLVAHIVKKFDNTGEETEDLISIGTVGLIKAIGTFDQDKNTRLATYAARCIENEILMYLRANKKNRNEVLLYDPIGSDKEGNEIKLIDILGTENDIVDEIVEGSIEKEKLKERIKKLGRRERKVLELRYGLDDGIEKTQREIARMLGISRSYVSRIEKKVMQRLFKEMAVESIK